MNRIFFSFTLGLILLFWGCSKNENPQPASVSASIVLPDTNATPSPSVYDYQMKLINGQAKNLSDFKGKVLLFVNVASKCGFTPQYADLQALYEQYKDSGLVILGFPANDFANQEPKGDAEISEFCSSEYGITFPMFSKIVVTGANANPLYKYLTGETGQAITWNFNKILVDRQGKPVKWFDSIDLVDDPKFLTELKKAL